MNRIFKVVWNEIRGSWMVCDENRVARGKAKSVKAVVVAVSVMTMMAAGNVLAETETIGEAIVNQSKYVLKNQTVTGNTKASDGWWGGKYYFYQTELDSSNNTYSNVTFAQTNGGPMGGVIHLYSNQLNQIASFTNDRFVGNTLSSTGTNSEETDWSAGGAVNVKGYTATFNDVLFQDNRVESSVAHNGVVTVGGAVFLDKTINTKGNADTVANFVINKDIAYTGNTVSNTGTGEGTTVYGGYAVSSGGFLFMDRKSTANFIVNEGATLTLGEAGATDTHADTIASSMTTDQQANDYGGHNLLTKQGAGTMVINSSLDGYYGKLQVENGELKVSQDWTISNEVAVQGGQLTVANMTMSSIQDARNQHNLNDGVSTAVGTLNVTGGNAELGSMNLGEKGQANISNGTLAVEKITIAENRNDKAVTLNGTGTLQTGSEQVMETGLNAEGTTDNAEKLNTVGNAINFNGGELALTDAKYNLDYAKSAQQLIGNTSLVMLGELVGQPEQLTVEALGDVDVGVLADVDITANKEGKQNLVVGSDNVFTLNDVNNNDYTSAETHNNSLGAKTLTLENGGKAVLVTGGKTLTLIGDGTDLIRTDDGSVNIDIGHNDDQSGTLNLGIDSAANGGTLSGTVTVSETGTVNVNGAEYGVNGKLDVSGTVNVNNGATLNTDTVTLNNSGTVNVAGTMKADTLTAAKETTINVGDSTSAGSLSASSLSLNGGMMFLDPDWRPGIGIEGASRAAFGSLPNGIDGSLVVGRNSLAVLGDTTTDWAQNEFARSGRNWGPGDITAALAIQAPQTLNAADNGAIVVDGSLTALPQTVTPNSVRFADNSMLIVDAAGIGSEAAITGNGTSQATVADSAALHIANARNGQEIGILKNFAPGEAINGWQGDNLTSSDAMISLNVTEDGSNGNVTVAATANNAADIFPGAMPVSTMNAIWQNGENDVDSANGGIAFLSRAADNRYLNHQDAVRTINGAAQMAVAAGVQLSNLQALDSVTEALENHVSLTANTQQANAPRLHDEGADLWAAMLYRHDSGDGMKSGSFNADINNNFGGLIVGSDYTWKLAGDTKTRVGAALSIGKGDSHSDGDYNYIKNDYDTYGINLYGSWNNRNVNIMADIGYMKGDNEVEQHLSQNLGGKLKADVDTEMWTAGIKGEYRIRTSALDITPHLGVRYTHLKTDSFSSRNTLGTVFNTDSESYNIWQMPLGVTLSKDYKSASGWTIKPKFDFSVIGAAGDTEAETRVRVPGVNAADNASADMMDSVSFRGIVSVEMQKDATSVGLSAGYQRSATMNSTGFMLNIGHHF